MSEKRPDVEALAREIVTLLRERRDLMHPVLYKLYLPPHDAESIVAAAIRAHDAQREAEIERLKLIACEHSCCGGLRSPSPCGGCCECIDAQRTYAIDKATERIAALEAAGSALCDEVISLLNRLGVPRRQRVPTSSRVILDRWETLLAGDKEG